MLQIFFKSVEESMISSAIICWGSSIRTRDLKKVSKLIKKAGSVLETPLEPLEIILFIRLSYTPTKSFLCPQMMSCSPFFCHVFSCRLSDLMFLFLLLASRCLRCRGDGYKTCSVCHGAQKLLHFIQLTVTWKNNISDFIPDRQPDFPDKKFEKVSGDPFFIDENVLVYPIQGFPDQEICDVSTKLIHEHLYRFTSTSRILQQVYKRFTAFFQFHSEVYDHHHHQHETENLTYISG
ncbi:hypothetical protein AMECASPLE_030695 [Ameca splendens]|uniref:Uncharacterized protein n=1 Tax=Ameca splendens TaxID=208324 RepID=A0ABV1AFR6_9TELE